MTVVQLSRMVQLWSYSVSHSQLLCRATKDRDHSTRVDVLFKGVQALQLPSKMAALSVREADPAEREAILAVTTVDVHDSCHYYVLEGPGFRGWVVAGAVVSVEDNGEYFEPSPLLQAPVGDSDGLTR